MSMRLIRVMSLNTKPNSIQIHLELFGKPVILNEGQGHIHQYQNLVTNNTYYHTKFEPDLFINN